MSALFNRSIVNWKIFDESSLKYEEDESNVATSCMSAKDRLHRAIVKYLTIFPEFYIVTLRRSPHEF